MGFSARVNILAALTAAIIAAATFLVPPIPQDPAYHLFADGRGWLGIPNFANVISNIGFAVVGFIGLAAVLRRGADGAGAITWDTVPYLIFFIGVALVGAGSAYYHWHPSNDTLFWDRLPITIAFMAISAAIVADRIHRDFGTKLLLPLLPALGVATLLYWDLSEQAGRGDLRFYGLVQLLPIVLIPVICRLFPTARITRGKYIVWIFLWYALAKLFELFDPGIYELLGGLVGGHALKHLAATIATAYVIPMAREAARRGFYKQADF